MRHTYTRYALVLDEVTELRHTQRSRQGMFTVFNLRSGTLVVRGLALRGRLDVRAGMRITAVLEVPGQWKTLVAWRFDDSRKVIWMRNISPTVAAIGLVVDMLIGIVTGIAVVLAAIDSKHRRCCVILF